MYKLYWHNELIGKFGSLQLMKAFVDEHALLYVLDGYTYAIADGDTAPLRTLYELV